jgi:hypothetical protein
VPIILYNRGMKDAKDIRGVDPKSWGAFDQGVSKVSKTLKVLLPVAGATTFMSAMSACSSAENKTPPAETAPLPASATPTIEATKIPTVEPTEAPRYTEILPATLEECKANNVIRWSHFDEDWKEFTNLVDAKAEINGDLIESFRTSTSALGPPSALSVHFENKNKVPGVACAYVDFEDGRGVLVFGIPVKRPKSPNIPATILYFGTDDQMMSEYYNQVNPKMTEYDYEKYVSPITIYSMIVNGEFDEGFLLPIISFPDMSESDPMWINLMKIYNKNCGSDQRANFVVPIMHFFEYSGKITEQNGIDGLKKLKNKIIPVKYLGIIY